uniref:GST N-terminal domain-containing protein n=1 Tax=Heterorhabditis bacteriophora TaxID=37862 RepID=A0A1I7WRS3_HETBA
MASTIDANFVIKCSTSALGRQLMSQQGEIEKNRAPTLDWVPWIMINGVRVKEAEYNLWNVLCKNYLVPKPVECDNYQF